jgi:formylglycine-generating enzyme required for sulfatase activity
MGIKGGLDNPNHLVFVDSFLLAKFEVTIGEWKEFTNEEPNPYLWGNFQFAFLSRRIDTSVMPSNWAMYYINWYDAILYCNWKSIKNGLTPAYKFDVDAMRKYLFERGKRPIVEWNRKANGYRLPTEAEWEYAARKDKTGDKTGKVENNPTAVEIELEAWTKNNSDGEVHPVGLKNPNSLGLFDMLGNVSEWVWDFYDSKYYSVSPRDNPMGPKKGFDPGGEDPADRNIRSVRGGNWITPTDYCDPYRRTKATAFQRGYIGLRLARNAQ